MLDATSENEVMQKHKAVIAALLATVFLGTTVPAMAQNAPPAQSGAQGGKGLGASPQMKMDRQAIRQACIADTQKLCGDVAAGGGKVMQCLRSHRADLSAGCQSAWGQLQADRKATRSHGT
jgi:hypothetical protein